MAEAREPQRCLKNKQPGTAGFLGSSDFAGFDVGKRCAECYRYDVAINLMSGGFCRSEAGGAAKRGPSNHDVVSPDGSRKTQDKA
jgi:hypothetical protein